MITKSELNNITVDPLNKGHNSIINLSLINDLPTVLIQAQLLYREQICLS